MKVLYVDDEEDIREIAKMSLELNPDFSVEICSSGNDALQFAPQWRPDLILLDVMMPGIDGPETLVRLSKIPETAKTPIIFITARTQRQEVEQFMSIGAIGVIGKPFEPMSLAGQVEALLKNATARD
ncbi:response regulator [Jiella sp. MQZ9-1]|uniref:Response regulator n=2 Tax=Jiella flava TaxID=2816857 RepID=A0A939FWQ3_9HYPH|nr:response regulator [Jiella flava]MBO0662146.1 response regulator [Jiella flava]MCD2470525.1 response regulator [Jiella flava]